MVENVCPTDGTDQTHQPQRIRCSSFRRTSVQVRNEGGLWDTSEEIYPDMGGIPKESFLEWELTSGVTIKFAHMEHEKNKLEWQGSQVLLIGFDELTHFSESQFFYMLSRNRSTCVL
ncbi:terminase large subunit domain-containing protein [Methanococcoides methylutens]|uniref:terminase large subunit domain-containing protein n=1 Tax=Methanococcoides methylutens TaxID=2226 RepID=UPI004043E3F4